MCRTTRAQALGTRAPVAHEPRRGDAWSRTGRHATIVNALAQHHPSPLRGLSVFVPIDPGLAPAGAGLRPGLTTLDPYRVAKSPRGHGYVVDVVVSARDVFSSSIAVPHSGQTPETLPVRS